MMPNKVSLRLLKKLPSNVEKKSFLFSFVFCFQTPCAKTHALELSCPVMSQELAAGWMTKQDV